MERIDEAHAEFRRALELDPLSLPINVDAARPFFRSGDYERAIGQLQKAIEIDPNYPRAHNVLANWYAQMGRYDEAVVEAKKAAALSAPAPAQGGPPQGSYQLVYIYAKVGRVSEARRMLEELERRTDRRNDQLYFQALAYAALGDRERAFALIEELYKCDLNQFLAAIGTNSLPRLELIPCRKFKQNRAIWHPHLSTFRVL